MEDADSLLFHEHQYGEGKVHHSLLQGFSGVLILWTGHLQECLSSLLAQLICHLLSYIFPSGEYT